MADTDRNDPGGDQGARKATGITDDDQGDTDVGRHEGEQHGYSPDVGQASEEVKQSGDRAFEGRDTQDASKSEGGPVYAPEKGAEHVGESVQKTGEEHGDDRKEAGRERVKEDTGDEGDEGGAARPRGKADPRMSTSVAPEDAESITSEDQPPGDMGG
jgi:hypothetical protein